jgi:hypothetical protein
MAIYKTAQELNAPISDDIRKVFDRMHGADEAVLAVEGRPGIDPLAGAPRTTPNYTSPPLEAVPTSFTNAAAKVEANVKVPANPEQAAMDRAIADAKDQGFDPETGSHDLELDVQAMRDQGALTAEDEQAIAASDETYKGATGWEEVMQFARSCVSGRNG